MTDKLKWKLPFPFHLRTQNMHASEKSCATNGIVRINILIEMVYLSNDLNQLVMYISNGFQYMYFELASDIKQLQTLFSRKTKQTIKYSLFQRSDNLLSFQFPCICYEILQLNETRRKAKKWIIMYVQSTKTVKGKNSKIRVC